MRTLRPVAIALDLLMVLVFATLGRGAHHEGLGPLGILQTAWPFLVGCAVGWTIVSTMLRRLPVWQQGLVIWVDALVIGMLLRMATGEGTHWSFVIVATVALGFLLVGWRLVWWFTAGRRMEAERRERRRRRAAEAMRAG